MTKQKNHDLRSVETLGTHGYENKTIIPDTVYILKKIRERAVETQDLAKTIIYINEYIARLETDE